eukprot:CAMPEP_0185023696 /NCGR_PEP_ID=MMETSP1103-20130426/6342_1 /TAXON_ID=36769 /ORGANISM="Paraphysomonas bandaiensis, Strain Caron Lab Isolate" /LENGTH=339 /DNA_ID=CAMNT_0027556411 /DNA_START=34 /DNA_END=1053 /DNA_ORIENTATION=+
MPTSLRWSEEETRLLREMREQCRDEISHAGQFPEVIGDRALIRFIRGHGHNLDKAVQKYLSYLNWRQESGADLARENIVRNGYNHPYKFPCGKKIIDVAPQIICAGDALDRAGNPIALETYNFSPSAVMREVSLDEYREFVVYCLQYKTLIIEQLSEKRERELLAQYNGNPPPSENGYGIILQCTIIRCLKGLGMEFMGSDSKMVLKATMEVAADNFPEMLYKTHIVNAPWIFNTLWYFIKGMLDVRTAAKVSFMGSNYLSTLEQEVPLESIPTSLGGRYEGYNEAFEFDTSEGGLLAYPHVEYPFSSPTTSVLEEGRTATTLSEVDDVRKADATTGSS